MTIEIPPDIPQWAVAAAAGEKFPLLDEDLMRALQAHLLQAMRASERASSNFDNLLAQLRLSGESEAITGAVQSGRGILLAWGGLTAGLGKLASHVEKATDDAELTKVVIITALSQLVAQVGIAVLFPPGAAAADLRAFAAARVAVREAIEWLIAKLGGRGLHLVVLGGAAQGALPNLVAQLYQIDNGDRQEIDRKSLATSIIAGGVGGVAGQKAAERLMPVLNRIDQRYVAQLPKKWLQKTARGGEVLAVIGAAGAAGGVAGLVAATVVSQQEFSLNYLVSAAAGGMSGSMIGGAVHAFRPDHSISEPDELGDLDKVAAADSYRADLIAASSASKRVWEDAVVAQRAATRQLRAATVPEVTAGAVVSGPGEVSDEAAHAQKPATVVPAVAEVAPATRPGTDVVPTDSAGPSQSRTTATSSGIDAPAGVPDLPAPHPDGGIPRIGDTEGGVQVEPRRPELIADATAAVASQPTEVTPRTNGPVGTARPDGSQTANGAKLAPSGPAEVIGDRVGQEGGVRPGRPAAEVGVSKVIAPEVVRLTADSMTDRRASATPSEANSPAAHPATVGGAAVSGATAGDQVPDVRPRSPTVSGSRDDRVVSADTMPGSVGLSDGEGSESQEMAAVGSTADGDRQVGGGDGVAGRMIGVGELNGEEFTSIQRGLYDAAQEILVEYHARSSEFVPEMMRLDDVPDEVLKFGLLHGDEHDSLLAAIETVRRHSGKLLYREQLMGVLAMREGLIPEMAPGSGKTLTAAVHNVWTAVHRGPTLLVTSSDPLAYEAFVEYNAIFGDSGVRFVRIDPDRPVPPPQSGEPTVYIATQDALGFAELRGHLDGIAFVMATVDEIDAALFYMSPTYVISDGAVRPASTQTARAIVAARDFVDDALAATTLTDHDFGRHPALPRLPARLTDEALANVRRLWEGELSDDDVKRINAAAAVALGDFVEGDHFVMHEGRPVIIDQVSHKVMRDPRTATESRWHDIAPAIEAAMAKRYDAAGREHTVVIHGNSETSKSTTLGEVLRRHVESLTGTSGTVMNTAEAISTVYGTGDAVAIPRTKQHRLEHGGTIVTESQHEKRTALIDNILDVSRKEGLPQLVLTHRNSDVAGIAAELRTRVPDESIEVVDAKWILDQGADWEERLHGIVEDAGTLGKITLINMQGGRGNDYKVHDEISQAGGIVAHLFGSSAISQDVDMQARNRVARNGQRGRVYEYIAVDDALFDRSGHPHAQLVITQYRDAATAYRIDPSDQHQAALDHAANEVLDMVPALQQQSLHRLKSLFVPTNIAALVDGLSSSGSIEPTAFVSEQTKPQATATSESTPAGHHDRDQAGERVTGHSGSFEPLQLSAQFATDATSDPASIDHARQTPGSPDTSAVDADVAALLRQPPPTTELLQQAQREIAMRDLAALQPGALWHRMPHYPDSAGGPGSIDVEPTDPGLAASTTAATETAPRAPSDSPRPGGMASPPAMEHLPRHTTTTDYLEAESGATTVASGGNEVDTTVGTTPWSHAPEHHQRRPSPGSRRPTRGKYASTTPWRAWRPTGDSAAAAATPWSSTRTQVTAFDGMRRRGFDLPGLLRRQGVEVALWQAERAGDVATVAELREAAAVFDQAGSSELVRLLDAAVVEGVTAPARRVMPSKLDGAACAVVAALRLRDFQSVLGNEWDRGIPRVMPGEQEVDPIAWSTVLGGHGEDRLGGEVGHRWVQHFLLGLRDGESGSVTVAQGRKYHGRAVVVMDKLGADSAHTYLVVNWKGTLLVVDPAGYERPFRFDPSRAGSVQAVRAVRLEVDGRPSDPIVTQIVDVQVDGAKPRTVVEDYWKSLPTERPPDAISHKDWMPAVAGVESSGPIPDPNDPGYESIGAWLAAMRRHGGLSARDLAERMERSHTGVLKAETSGRVTADYLRAFGVALGIPGDVLWLAVVRFEPALLVDFSESLGSWIEAIKLHYRMGEEDIAGLMGRSRVYDAEAPVRVTADYLRAFGVALGISDDVLLSAVARFNPELLVHLSISLGAWLEAFRLDRGLSLNDLAGRMAWNGRTVYEAEKSVRVTADYLRAFGVTLEISDEILIPAVAGFKSELAADLSGSLGAWLEAFRSHRGLGIHDVAELIGRSHAEVMMAEKSDGITTAYLREFGVALAISDDVLLSAVVRFKPEFLVDFSESMGVWLEHLRSHYGPSQQKLAELMKRSQAAVSDAESSGRVTVGYLWAFGAALKVPDEIMKSAVGRFEPRLLRAYIAGAPNPTESRYESIGAWLRAYRAAYRLHRGDLATRMGLTYDEVFDVEAGGHVSADYLRAFGAVMDVPDGVVLSAVMRFEPSLAAHFSDSLGAWLKAFRLHRNLTQTELAARIGLSPATVSRAEAGGRVPVGYLHAIGVVLGVPDGVVLSAVERFDPRLASRLSESAPNPTAPEYQSIGAWLHAARQSRGLTQQQLANAIGRNRSTVRRAEDGEVTAAYLRAVGTPLGISRGLLQAAVVRFEPRLAVEFSESLGSWFEAFRLDRGLSQLELADLIFRDRDTVSAAEASGRVTADYLRAFGVALGIPDDVLWSAVVHFDLRLAYDFGETVPHPTGYQAIGDWIRAVRHADLPDPDLAARVVVLHLIDEFTVEQTAARLGIASDDVERLAALASSVLRTVFGRSDSADRDEPEQAGETQPKVHQAMHVAAPTRRDEIDTDPSPELDRLGRLVESDQELISHHASWDPREKAFTYRLFDGRVGTIGLRLDPDPAAAAVQPEIDISGGRHILYVATSALRAEAADIHIGRSIAGHVEAIRVNGQQHAVPTRGSLEYPMSISVDMIRKFAELRYVVGRIGRGGADHLPESQRALEGLITDLGLHPNEPHAATRMKLLNAWDPRSRPADRLRELMPSLTPERDGRFWSQLAKSKIARLERLWRETKDFYRYSPERLEVALLDQFRRDSPGSDSALTHAELLRQVDADSGLITRGYGFWDATTARFTFLDGDNHRVELVVWTSPEPISGVAAKIHQSDFVNDVYHVFVSPSTLIGHASLAVADALGQIRHWRQRAIGPVNSIGGPGARMTYTIAGRFAQLGVLVGKLDRAMAGSGTESVANLRMDLAHVVSELGRKFSGSQSFTWPTLLARHDALLAERVAYWQSKFGFEHTEVTPSILDETDYPYDIEVRNVGDFHGRARPAALPDLAHDELLHLIETDLSLIATSHMRWVHDHFEFTDREGSTLYFYVEAHKVRSNLVACWGHDFGKRYRVSVSPRTHPEDVSRAVKGALDQFIDQYNEPRVPWIYEYGQLRVVVEKLDAAASLGESERVQVLGRKLAALAAELRIRPADPGSDHRMRVLAERDEDLARRSTEWILRTQHNRVAVDAVYGTRPQSVLSLQGAAVRANAVVLAQRRERVIGEVWDVAPVESARAMREGGVHELHASLQVALQLRSAGETLPITVTGLAIDEHIARAAIEGDLTIGVSSIEQLQQVAATAQLLDATAKVAVEVDTGKHTGGVPLSQYTTMVSAVSGHVAAGTVELCSVFTELAHDDDPWHPMNDIQARRFYEVQQTTRGYDDLEGHGIFHIAGAALALRPELGSASAARFGAPLYGHLPVEFPGLVLQHAVTWWSRAIHIQDVPAGEGVGYDGVPVDRPRRIAWIGGGYADRMPYEWGRSAKDLYVSVNGVRLRVAGPVSMDAFPVEIPPGAEVDFGDVAVLAGPGADGELTLDQWSGALGVPVEQLLNTPPGRTRVASHDGIALVAPEIFDRSTFDPRLASAWASADTDALANNLAVTRQRISDKVRQTDLPLVEPRIMLVLKADAYGNGSEVIALAGARAGVDFIGAALIDETLKLRASGVTTRLLAWQTHPYSDFVAAIGADVSVAVSSLTVLRAVAAAAKAVGRPAKVHLAVNTGLNREGVSPDRLADFIRELRHLIDHGWIEFEGVMSHVDHVEERWETQYRRFSAAVELLVASGLTPELQHLWASAALDVPADRLFTMVRTGIALYGMPSDLGPDPDLRQVLRVHSRVAHVMAVSEGAGVGSRHAWIASRDTTIARITIGYGDLQLPRPGTYQVWIEGDRYEVVGQGRDFILVDLGPDSGIRENTEVVLLGPGDRGEPTLRDWAMEAGFSEAPMLGWRVAVTAFHDESGVSDPPSSIPTDEGHRSEPAPTRSRASADATGRSATGAVATGGVLAGRNALGEVEGDERVSGDGTVAYQRPADGRGHKYNQCGPMVVDDVADVFGRDDIRRLGTAGLSGVLISELERALGGQTQHLTGTVEAVGRLAALGRALDVEQPGRGNGVAVVVLEPAVSGRRGNLGHAWWLIRRVGPNGTVRFELRDPGKGQVLPDFVPAQSVSNGRGVLALYLDNKGYPVAGGASDSDGVVRWRGSSDDFAIGRDLDLAVGARSAVAGFGPHHGLVDGQSTQVEELDEPERAGRLAGDTRSAAGVSKKGTNHDRNDDAMTVVEFTREGKPVVVAAVFDGVGGAPDGHRAAREAAVELGAYLKENWPQTLFKRALSREAVLRDALHHVHQKVQSLARRPEYADSEDKPQCTVAVVVTEPDRFTVGWVGDSRVGWASADGRHAMWWTADHSYIRRFAKELGTTESQAIQQFPWLEKSRHIIEYALGRAFPAEPNDHVASEEYVTTVLVSDGIDAPVRAENGQLEVPRGGVVIAGTDGAVKTMSTAEEFGRAVRRHAGDLGAIANDVVDRAVESGETDDITVVAVQQSPQERRAWWRRKPRSGSEFVRGSAAPPASKDGTAERVPVATSLSAHELNQCGPQVLKLHRQDTGNAGVVTTRVVGLGGMWVKDFAVDSGGRLQYFPVDRNRAHLHVEEGLRALVAGLLEGQRDGVSVLVVDGHREFGEYGVAGHVYRLVYRADENGANGWIEVQDPGKALSGLFEDTADPAELRGIWAMAFDRNGHPLELPGGTTDGPAPEFFVGRSREHDEQHALSAPDSGAAVENESTDGRSIHTAGSQLPEAGSARSAADGLLVGGRRTADPTDPHRPLRVVTWNIAGGRRVLSYDSNKPFDYSEVDLPYFVEQLRRIDADVICLQETEIGPDGSTAQQLAAMLGYRYVYETDMSPSHMDTSKRLGIAVLSRLPIQDAESHRLPPPQFELKVRAERVQPYARFAQVVRVAGIPVGNVSPMPLHVFKDEAGKRYTYESGEGAIFAKEIGRTVTAMLRGPGIWAGDTNTDNPVLVYGQVFDKLGMVAALDPAARTVPPHPRRPVGAPDQLWAAAETFGVAASGTVDTETDHYPAWVDWDVTDPELAGLLSTTRQVEREVAVGEDAKPGSPGDTSGVDRPSGADGAPTGRAFQVGGATFYATGEQVPSSLPSDGSNTGTAAPESGERLGAQNDVVSRNSTDVDWNTLLGGPGQPRVVLLGEEHSNSRTRAYLADLAAELKAKGVTHFGIEALAHPKFDALNNGESVDLEGVSCGPGRYGLGAIGRSYRKMVLAIAAQGIKIVPIDLSISNPRSIDWRTLLEREEHMTTVVAGALGERPDAKMVVLVGKSHVGPELWGNKSLSRRLREEQYPVTSVLLEGGYDSKEPAFEDGVLNLPPGMDHPQLEAIAETHVGVLGRGLPAPMAQVASGLVSALVCLLDGEMQLKLRNLADRGMDVLEVGLTGQAGGASYMVLKGPPGDPILEQILRVRMRAGDLVARDVGRLISEMLYDCDHVSTLSGTVAALLTRLPVHPQDDLTWSASVGRDQTGRRILQCLVYDQRGKPLADMKIPLLPVPNDTRSPVAGAQLAPPDGEGNLPTGGAASSSPWQRAAADAMTGQRIPHLVESSDSSGFRGADVVVYLPAELARSLLGAVGDPGRRAREVLDEYGISVSYGSYPVSRYDTVRNHIDLELWEDGHAARLVEMTVHAKWALEGWSARNDPVAFARDAFVYRAHEEDAAAAVERIFATMELQRVDPGVPDAPAQRQYREGYRLALTEAKSAGLTVDEQLSAADRGGRGAVFRHLIETNFRNPGADWDIAVAESQDASEWIDLYSGTDRKWAAIIRSDGVDTNFPRYRCDFGQGFYLTRDYAQAEDWASVHPHPEVLHYRIRRQDLDALSRKSFSDESHDLADFVRHYRTGGGGTPHDVIEGPMLLNPRQYLAGDPPEWGGNQVVFYGGTGAMLDAALQPRN
ncbi:alanine racemase [Nocardia sp. NPDC049220]|uniref:alanine racemase n=1 Tax=Nocardia sp. NPDC049220 TaxID=3155273 RepID=UPI00341137B2